MTVTALGGPLVVALDGSGCSTDDVGSKAAGLDRLAAHGFPVPAAAALTVWAYRRFVSESGLSIWLEELSGSPIPEPAALEAAAEDANRRFLAADMPSDVHGALVAAAAPLLAAGAVAVRSSANAEDLGIASFAGQYVSLLGVADLLGVERAVRLCWASLWRPAARAYRLHNGIEESDLAMGVVLQTMVEPDWSGVGFTRDPEQHADVIRIEVVPGFGEGLVSGRITPGDFIVDRETLVVRSAGGATPPVFLEDLGRLLLQVEDRLDEPQDVEWASAGGELTLLQARPITVAGPTTANNDGFDRPIGSRDTFTPRGVVEMLPGVVPPLLWTINAPMIEHAYRTVVASLGEVSLDFRRPFLGRFGGRAALNLSALQDLAETLPGGSAREVQYQFLGHAVADEPDDNGSERVGLRKVLKARAAQRAVADEVELCRASAQAIVDLRIDIEALPATRLLAYGRSVRDLAWRLVAAEVAASSAAAASYRGLELLLQRWVGEEGATLWAQRLTAGTIVEDAVGVQLTRRLAVAVDRAAATTSGLRPALAARPGRRAHERVRQLGEGTAAFRTEIDWIIRSQGCQAIYGGPTWAEHPDLVWDQLALLAPSIERTAATASSGSALEELVAELAAKRGWRTLRILTGQVVDLRVRWLRRQVAEASRFLRLREQAKAALLTLGGEERRVISEASRRLVASSQLETADDVELLSDVELTHMVLGAPPPPAAELFRRRKVRARCLERPNLPATFVGTPDAAPAEFDPSAATLDGWAASPGIVEGSACVLDGIAEGGKLAKGDVLVAKATDPSWTPLLLLAGGLVLEEGGPLSHGAIVAREFGVPAVLNVPGAVSVIADGERIEVDGFAGRVRRLHPAEEVAVS